MSKLYLITPEQIDADFIKKLTIFLEEYSEYISYLQLRIKPYDPQQILYWAEIIHPICQNHNVKLILNDHVNLLDLGNFDGIHIGQEDYDYNDIPTLRNKYPNHIIGVSCYNQLSLATQVAEYNINYVAFGSFFPSKTKTSTTQAHINLLTQWQEKNSEVETCAIGGINDQTIHQLTTATPPNHICMISYIWNHPANQKLAFNKILCYFS